jgi:chromosome segregation protein
VRESLVRRAAAARSAADRIELRLERARESGAALAERIDGREHQLALLRAQATEDQPDDAGLERIEALEAELVRLDEDREAALARELQRSTAAAQAAARVDALDRRGRGRAGRRSPRPTPRPRPRAARARGRGSAEAARREAAKVGAELSRANQFLRSHASAPGGARALADELQVAEGYELALAAALGGRMTAAIAPSRPRRRRSWTLPAATAARALVLDGEPDPAAARPASAGVRPSPRARIRTPAPRPSRPRRRVRGPSPPPARAPAARRAWVGADLGASADLHGARHPGRPRLGRARRGARPGRTGRRSACSPSATAATASSGSPSRAVQGRARRRATRRGRVGRASPPPTAPATGRARPAEAERARNGAREEVRQAELTMAQRRARPRTPPTRCAARRSRASCTRSAQRRARARVSGPSATPHRPCSPPSSSGPGAAALARAGWPPRSSARWRGPRAGRRRRRGAGADQQAGEGVAATLRACAADENRVQHALRERNEALPARRSARSRHATRPRRRGRSSSSSPPASGSHPSRRATRSSRPVADELRRRIERLVRRREQLGPVNPLAKAEYDEALAHVERWRPSGPTWRPRCVSCAG